MRCHFYVKRDGLKLKLLKIAADNQRAPFILKIKCVASFFWLLYWKNSYSDILFCNDVKENKSMKLPWVVLFQSFSFSVFAVYYGCVHVDTWLLGKQSHFSLYSCFTFAFFAFPLLVPTQFLALVLWMSIDSTSIYDNN